MLIVVVEVVVVGVVVVKVVVVVEVNMYARSARIRPCMWRIHWRNVYAVRSGTLMLDSQSTQ